MASPAALAASSVGAVRADRRSVSDHWQRSVLATTPVHEWSPRAQVPSNRGCSHDDRARMAREARRCRSVTGTQTGGRTIAPTIWRAPGRWPYSSTPAEYTRTAMTPTIGIEAASRPNDEHELPWLDPADGQPREHHERAPEGHVRGDPDERADAARERHDRLQVADDRHDAQRQGEDLEILGAADERAGGRVDQRVQDEAEDPEPAVGGEQAGRERARATGPARTTSPAARRRSGPGAAASRAPGRGSPGTGPAPPARCPTTLPMTSSLRRRRADQQLHHPAGLLGDDARRDPHAVDHERDEDQDHEHDADDPPAGVLAGARSAAPPPPPPPTAADSNVGGQERRRAPSLLFSLIQSKMPIGERRRR